MKMLETPLTINQWNAIISICGSLPFNETKKILDSIGEQSKDTKVHGEEKLVIKLTAKQIKQIIAVLQFTPYNVGAQVIYLLYEVLQANGEGESPVEPVEE